MANDRRATGGCLCGAVRFVAEGEPFRVGLCHCLDCRKDGGAPFGAYALFPAERVRFSRDPPATYASAAHGRRHFCGNGGAPLFGRDERSAEVELHLGSFDLTGRFAPTYELGSVRRESWLRAVPGVVRRDARNRPGPQRSAP